MAPPKISRCVRFEATRGEYDIACKRTDYLLHQLHRPLVDLVANAYLQGVIDAAETVSDRVPQPLSEDQ